MPWAKPCGHEDLVQFAADSSTARAGRSRAAEPAVDRDVEHRAAHTRTSLVWANGRALEVEAAHVPRWAERNGCPGRNRRRCRPPRAAPVVHLGEEAAVVAVPRRRDQFDVGDRGRLDVHRTSLARAEGARRPDGAAGASRRPPARARGPAARSPARRAAPRSPAARRRPWSAAGPARPGAGRASGWPGRSARGPGGRRC